MIENQTQALEALKDLQKYILSMGTGERKRPKLTLPVNKDGKLSGKTDAHEIKGDELDTYSDEWYWVDEEGQHFIAPGQDEKPALTDNAKYGRTEILDENRFDMNATYELKKIVTIKEIPVNGKLVFMQIHRGNKAGKSLPPLAKFVADAKGGIRCLVKKTADSSDTEVTFAHKFKLNEPFEVTEKYEKGTLRMSINGDIKGLGVDLTGADATYGKWGNYNNSAKGRGHVVIKDV